MNTLFGSKLSEAYKILLEQDMPSSPGPTAPPMGPDTGAGPIDVAPGDTPSALPGQDGAPPSAGDMEDDVKRDTDAVAYTENMLATLVDPEKGITPEMFAQYLNTFDIASTKVKDKEGFAKFYSNFYNKLRNVVETKEEMKRLFATFLGSAKNVLTHQEQTPDNAGGGIGKDSHQGPTGPGVR